jgi:hypothetical protein
MRSVAAAFVVAGALLASSASAEEAAVRSEPSASDLATARTALKEGLARREEGDIKGAIARLSTAFDLVPTPVTCFELGKAHMMAGNVLQAHELFKKVERMPLSLEESSRSEIAREESMRLAKEIEPRIPSLRIRLTLPSGATAAVRVDDEDIATSDPETLRAVDPGWHEIIAKAGEGPEQRVRVEVAEGEVKDVELAPQWIAPKPRPKPEDDRKRYVTLKTTHPMTVVAFAAASAGFGLTTLAGVNVLTRRSDLREKCTPDYCPKHLEGDIDAYQAWSAVFAVSGIATAALVGVGLFFVLNPSKERVLVGIQPAFGPGGASLRGRF